MAKKKRLTSVQTFKPTRINRSDMVFMPGNPQEMDEDQSEALAKALNVKGGGVGLVETVVWNRRTGHIVGGNHRVRKIDEAEGYDPEDPATHGQEYSIDVAEMDMDPDDEKALVVLLNNRRLQGQPRVDALQAFLGQIPPEKRERTGFTGEDMEVLLGNKIQVKDKRLDVGQLLWGPNFKIVHDEEELEETNAVPEPPKVAVTQPGDVWLLGAFFECEDCGKRYEYEEGLKLKECPCGKADSEGEA